MGKQRKINQVGGMTAGSSDLSAYNIAFNLFPQKISIKNCNISYVLQQDNSCAPALAKFLSSLPPLCIVPSHSLPCKVPTFLVSSAFSVAVGFLGTLEIQRRQNEKDASVTPYKEEITPILLRNRQELASTVSIKEHLTGHAQLIRSLFSHPSLLRNITSFSYF